MSYNGLVVLPTSLQWHASEFSYVRQFSRTVSSVSSKGPPLIALMKHFKWTAAVMFTSTGVHTEMGSQLTQKLQV